MIIYDNSDTFSKPYVKRDSSSNAKNVFSFNLRSITSDTFSEAMVFDTTPAKSKQLSKLRQQTF